jgi:uracil-DNA glycosylase family 4
MLNREELVSDFTMLAEASGLDVQAVSSGPVDATVAFIGEGLGEVEVRKKAPFVGQSGHLLWRHVDRYGLKPSNVYSTNVMKRQVSMSDDPKLRMHPDEFRQWKELLHWELGQLPELKTVVLLGNYALLAMTDKEGINAWRGSVLDIDLPNGNRGMAVCANNPAYPLREPKAEITFMMDMQKLGQVVSGKFKPHAVEAIINPKFHEVMAFIRDLQWSEEPVAVDIEGLNNETACIGLANEAHLAMCINFRDANRNVFTLEQEYDVWAVLQKLFDSHRLIAQNGGFDAYWLRLHDWIRIQVWFDTLLAHHTLYPQLPHNLAYLTAQYTNHPYYKSEGDYWKEGGDINEFWIYNCKDAAITWAVAQKEEQELEKQGLSKFFFSHVMRAQPHLVEATVHGLPVDQTVKAAIAIEIGKDVAALENEFHRLVHECTNDETYYPNPGSWQQLRELFFSRLSLQGVGMSTDSTNRMHIIKHASTRPIEREMLTALTKYKEEDKFRGTYANAKESADGRFRFEFKQYGVSNAPGRLSSSQLINGEGGNIQNQPVRARGFFVADPGCCYIYFDLAQAEAQVVSFRADIVHWKEQFARARRDGSYDCHRALASEMFKIPYADVPTKDWDEDSRPTVRYVAKRCRHGLNYRMERFRLAEVTGLSYHTAARAFTLYHKITPELQEWWKQEEATFKKERALFNALGRRFRVLQPVDDEVSKSVVAFYPQSTIGDKVVQVWYQAEEDSEWPKGHARVAINVHDNLVGVAEPKYAKTALRILKKYAESPIFIQDAWGRRPAEPLSIAAECKISYPTSWDANTRRFVEDKNGLHRWSNMKVVRL